MHSAVKYYRVEHISVHLPANNYTLCQFSNLKQKRISQILIPCVPTALGKGRGRMSDFSGCEKRGMRGKTITGCFSPVLWQLGAWWVSLFTNSHPILSHWEAFGGSDWRQLVSLVSPGVLQVPLPAVPRVASEQSAGDAPHPKICQRPLHPAVPAGPAAPQKELQGDNRVIWGAAAH